MQNDKIDINKLLNEGIKYNFIIEDNPITVLYTKTKNPNNPLSKYEDIVVFRVKYSNTAPFEKGEWVENKEKLKEYLSKTFNLNTDDEKKEKALNSLDFEVYTYADYQSDKNKENNIAYLCIVGNDKNGDNDYTNNDNQNEVFFIDNDDNNIIAIDDDENIENVVSKVAKLITNDMEKSLEKEKVDDNEFSLDFDEIDVSNILANINQNYIDEEDYIYDDDYIDNIDFTVEINTPQPYSETLIDRNDNRLLNEVNQDEIFELVEYEDYTPLSTEERNKEMIKNMKSISGELDIDNQLETFKTMVANSVLNNEEYGSEEGEEYEKLIIDMFKNNEYTSSLLSQYDEDFYDNFNSIDYLDEIGDSDDISDDYLNDNDYIDDFESYLSNYDNSVIIDGEQRKSTAVSAIEQLFNFKNGNIYDIYVLDKDNNILNVLNNEAVDVDETSARIIANYYS